MLLGAQRWSEPSLTAVRCRHGLCAQGVNITTAEQMAEAIANTENSIGYMPTHIGASYGA